MELMLIICLFVFSKLFIARFLLGKAIFVEVAGLWIHDISKSLIKVPIKIIGYILASVGRLIRLLTNR
jgi:hypothetical protein